MDNLSDLISGGIAQFIEDLSEKIHQLTEDLSDEQIWTKPYSYGNSIGHLILHLTGNLNHFFGHLIGDTDYVRERDREFNETEKISQSELFNNFDMAVETALSVVYAQDENSWSKSTDAGGIFQGKNRFEVILFCSGHIFNHLGQIIYLANELKTKN